MMCFPHVLGRMLCFVSCSCVVSLLLCNYFISGKWGIASPCVAVCHSLICFSLQFSLVFWGSVWCVYVFSYSFLCIDCVIVFKAVSLCSPGLPGTLDYTVLTSKVPRLQACATCSSALWILPTLGDTHLFSVVLKFILQLFCLAVAAVYMICFIQSCFQLICLWLWNPCLIDSM